MPVAYVVDVLSTLPRRVCLPCKCSTPTPIRIGPTSPPFRLSVSTAPPPAGARLLTVSCTGVRGSTRLPRACEPRDAARARQRTPPRVCLKAHRFQVLTRIPPAPAPAFALLSSPPLSYPLLSCPLVPSTELHGGRREGKATRGRPERRRHGVGRRPPREAAETQRRRRRNYETRRIWCRFGLVLGGRDGAAPSDGRSHRRGGFFTRE